MTKAAKGDDDDDDEHDDDEDNDGENDKDKNGDDGEDGDGQDDDDDGALRSRLGRRPFAKAHSLPSSSLYSFARCNARNVRKQLQRV
eukprot:734714-Pyramimonas_sp.AAC.1